MSDSEQTGNPWRVRARRVAYDNPWIQIVDHDVVTPTGAPGLYGVVSFKNLAIGIVPIHADGSVTLVGQHRFPLDRYSWELPEGGGDPNVAPVDSAKRELKEETGLTAGRWREFIRFNTSNSITDELAICFLATDLEEGVPDPDDDEILAHRRMPFAEALDLVASGEIMDSLTIVMLLRADHMARTGELEPEIAALIR